MEKICRLLFCLLPLLLLGCDEEDADRLLMAFITGSGSVSCNINGIHYERYVNGKYGCGYTHYENEQFKFGFTVPISTSSRDAANEMRLKLEICNSPELELGKKYELFSADWSTTEFPYQRMSFGTLTCLGGWVEIQELIPTEVEYRFITKGTFEFDAMYEDGRILHVTDGVFDLYGDESYSDFPPYWAREEETN